MVIFRTSRGMHNAPSQNSGFMSRGGGDEVEPRCYEGTHGGRDSVVSSVRKEHLLPGPCIAEK
ncbi:hypothetical protein WN51_03830 [Melipona quadrifasciata]|uniref:Uncharacterized protein n=1 Tax=Melipona quadrifasciata TaxID=166423 RepID=A0A0N0BKL5_9HYME|nr:hypothetical protein WN51_03830 [Melipona quadrifasciata]